MIYDIIVIGAGASGCMASITASKNGAKVLLLERNEKIGKKLYITGKGRCNLTNNSENDVVLNNIITGKQFMYGAIKQFNSQDCMNFFENRGLKLKTERGNRVFPESDKSSDVIRIFEKEIKKLNIDLLLNTKVTKITKFNDLYIIKCNSKEEYTAKCVVLTTGGKSYPLTGSDGLGYSLAESLGHKITPIKPSLVPIILKDDVKSLEGISLKNVEVSAVIDNKICAKEFGEMVFTDNGVSGPIILTLSSKINNFDLESSKILLDFKPALTDEMLDEKFIREFKENPKKRLSTYLKQLLPNNLIKYFMNHLNIDDKNLAEMTKEDRKCLISSLKRFDFSIKMLDNVENAIVTHGGIDLLEVNPKTMESKLNKNLFFAGEVLNIDALTGGFNLQVAFSTGYLAGISASRSILWYFGYVFV